MFIGLLRVRIFIPHSRSLKERRSVISSIKQKVYNRFTVSIAQKPSDKWQSCELAIVCVNYANVQVVKMLSQIEEYLRSCPDIQLLEAEQEIL